MLTGDAYFFEHLVPSHLGLVYVFLVETNPFLELVLDFPVYALRISLGTFSIFHCTGRSIIYLTITKCKSFTNHQLIILINVLDCSRINEIYVKK